MLQRLTEHLVSWEKEGSDGNEVSSLSTKKSLHYALLAVKKSIKSDCNNVMG